MNAKRGYDITNVVLILAIAATAFATSWLISQEYADAQSSPTPAAPRWDHRRATALLTHGGRLELSLASPSQSLVVERFALEVTIHGADPTQRGHAHVGRDACSQDDDNGAKSADTPRQSGMVAQRTRDQDRAHDAADVDDRATDALVGGTYEVVGGSLDGTPFGTLASPDAHPPLILR